MNTNTLLAVAAMKVRDYSRTCDNIEKMVITHATGAAVAAGAAGAVPGLSSALIVAVCTGFVWSLYFRLAKSLGVGLNKDILKALGSAVLGNIVGNVVATLGAVAVTSLLPGGQVISMAIAAAAQFGMVYIAGIIFLKVLGALMERSHGADLKDVTLDELKREAKAAAKDVNFRDAMKEAKRAYKAADKSEAIEVEAVDAETA